MRVFSRLRDIDRERFISSSQVQHLVFDQLPRFQWDQLFSRWESPNFCEKFARCRLAWRTSILVTCPSPVYDLSHALSSVVQVQLLGDRLRTRFHFGARVCLSVCYLQHPRCSLAGPNSPLPTHSRLIFSDWFSSVVLLRVRAMSVAHVTWHPCSRGTGTVLAHHSHSSSTRNVQNVEQKSAGRGIL